MAKLWQKNYTINSVIDKFTVDKDFLVDLRLVGADCAASIAHARMLHKESYLTEDQLKGLEDLLREIYANFLNDTVQILPEQEDCHTYIEDILTRKLNESGRQIHLGRSRNDQSLTAIRLYAREYILEIQESLNNAIHSIAEFAQKYKATPMPGRTHLQIAMPSSIGFWASAYAEELLDAAQFLQSAFEIYNRSPLGSAAGYGTPLELNREFTAEILGFPSIQHNALAVQNSRGRLEALVCDSIDQIGIIASKISQDLILFTLPEFSYFSLPEDFYTGSSIMPQKKNPDFLELARSRSAGITGYSLRIKSIIRSLPSGYNRDFQDTKEPFFNCLETILPILEVVNLIFQNLKVQEANLRGAHSPEIFATDEAIELVHKGMSFRSAYQSVGRNLNSLREYPIDETLAKRRSAGHPANLNIPAILKSSAEFESNIQKQKLIHITAMQNLLNSESGISKLYLNR